MMRGLRLVLTPFAPDQSGAVSVLFELGGLIVICDAGGCTGNICGFDEPRWHEMRSAVFSAGLRDMDAILGRDDKLVGELADAARHIDAQFAAIVGTPVPSVIGTDYHALRRMSERKTSLPVLGIDTTGMELYDVGASKAYVALFDRFATEDLPSEQGRIGVIGANPLDLMHGTKQSLHAALPGAVVYGKGEGLDAVKRASSVEKNIVVAPSGLEAARLLDKRFGTPYELYNPLAASMIPEELEVYGKRVLVVQQQVTAVSMREELLRRGASSVVCATWFMQIPELVKPGDMHLKDEDDLAQVVAQGNFDLLIGDAAQWPIVPNYAGTTFDVPEFAVSGRRL